MNYNNIKKHRKFMPYMAHNIKVRNLEVNTEPELPIDTKVNENLYEDIIESTGYINVGVYTALGALPVKDAVVTIYALDGDEEIALYILGTDISGRVPRMEVPVFYDETNPLQSPDFYFTTYNMRVQAIGYYNVNVIDLRVFPNTATNYSVVLIPVMEGGTEEESNQTIVIPETPADISNE